MSPQIKLKVKSLKLKVGLEKIFNSQLSTLNSKKGFTLLELLVVIAILGILASITFAILKPAFLFGQARDTQRRSDLKQIQNALQQYYTDFKCYPNSNNAWVDVATLASTTDVLNCIRPLVPNYLKKMPTDPLSGRIYQYLEPNTNNSCADNQAYALRSQFEGSVVNTAVWSCDGSTTGLTTAGYLHVTSD